MKKLLLYVTALLVLLLSISCRKDNQEKHEIPDTPTDIVNGDVNKVDEDSKLIIQDVVTTDYYNIRVPSEWIGNVYYRISDNKLVFYEKNSASKFDKKALLSITQKNSIEDAWEIIDSDANSICYLTYDWAYIFSVPDYERDDGQTESSLSIQVGNLWEFTQRLNINKDGQNNSIQKSLSSDVLWKLKQKTDLTYAMNRYGLFLKHEVYGYNYIKLFDFTRFDRQHEVGYKMILSDKNDIMWIDIPSGIETQNINVYPFADNSDGVSGYCLFSYSFLDSGEKESLMVVEKKDTEQSASSYKLKIDEVIDLVKERVTYSVTKDSDSAVFSLNDKETVTIRSDQLALGDSYILDDYFILWSDSPLVVRDGRHYIVMFIPKLEKTDGTFDDKNSPVIMANVEYAGNGKFDIEDIIIKRIGRCIDDCPDLINRSIITDDDFTYIDNICYPNPLVLDDQYITCRVRILGFDDNGNILLRKFDDNSESDNVSFTEGAKKSIRSEDICLSVEPDCEIRYYVKQSNDWTWRRLNLEDLKFLVNNYFYRMTIDNNEEYLLNFECSYKGNTLYYLAEIFES